MIKSHSGPVSVRVPWGPFFFWPLPGGPWGSGLVRLVKTTRRSRMSDILLVCASIPIRFVPCVCYRVTLMTKSRSVNSSLFSSCFSIL